MKTVKEIRNKPVVGPIATPPPSTLLLIRKSIRQFPDGKSVAMYYSDRLGKFISIPFDNSKINTPIITEEKEVLEEGTPRHKIFAKLKAIVNDKRVNKVKFANGTTTNVDQFTAQKVLDLYDALGLDAKKKLSKLAATDKLKFARIVRFAHHNIK